MYKDVISPLILTSDPNIQVEVVQTSTKWRHLEENQSSTINDSLAEVQRFG